MIVDYIILGGGVAGLAAARAATRRGASFLLLEAAPRLGGNAITLRHDGFRFDSGAHRLHDRDVVVTQELRRLLGERLRPVSPPSRIYSRGSFVDFPFALAELVFKLGPGTLLRAASECARMMLSARKAPTTFAELAVATYGRTIAERFLLNYTEKLWGTPCARLSTAVAGARLKGLDPWSMLKRTLGSQVESLDGSFLYPTGGIGEIADALAGASRGGCIRTGAPVTRLHHDGSRLVTVEAGGQGYRPEQVICTLPITTTVALLDPAPTPAIREWASGIRFRHLVLAAFFLDRDGISPYASTYFPDAGHPFTRIHEPRCRSPSMAPAGKTSLVAELPCGDGDETWSAPDAIVLDRVRAHLLELGWIRAHEELGASIHRMPNAYPVLDIDALQSVHRIHDALSRIDNLTCLGRAATFSYVHIHDLVRHGLDAIEQIEARRRAVRALEPGEP